MAFPAASASVQQIKTPTYGDIMQERDAFLVKQNALAQQQLKQQQNAMLNQAYRAAYDPKTGAVDTNKLFGSLASGGMGSEIPGQMEAVGKGVEAVAKGGNERIKLQQEILTVSRNELGNANTPEAAMAAGMRIAQQYPEAKDGILQSLAEVQGMTPEQFGAWKMNALRKNLSAAQQLEQDTQTQDLGGSTRVLTRPKYGSSAFAVAPGSEAQKTMTPQQQYEVEHPDLKPMTVEGIGLVGFNPRTNTYKTAAPAGGGGGGVPTGRGGADTVYGNGRYGAPATPLSSMTIGQVQDYQRNSLIPATRGKVGAGPDKGTGAVGTYQITYGTLQKYAPKVLGANWQSAPFTADAQDKLARAIYEDNKNGDLSKIWAGLPANKPGAYSNVPWEQVRGQIAAAESGGGAAPAAGAPAQPTGTEEVAKRKAFENILPIIGYDAKTGKNRVADLIEASSSGGAEMLGSEVAGFFGSATPGRKALSELNAIAASMTFEKLRGKLGAQISDSDVRLVANTMADIANGYKTAGERSAAWNNVVLPILLRGAGVEAPAAGGGIPASAIQHLRNNPSLKAAFDSKYGPGAAAKVLGGR